ncbi:MAG TPA: ATP-binding protein [Opitutaceae bacterium]|jgi:heavy metal sensor kinase
MNPRSLRFRLTAWHAAVLAGVFIALGTVLYLQLGSELSRVVLSTQERRARQIGETLIAKVGSEGEAYVTRTIPILYAPEQANRFIRVLRPDGSTLYRSGPPTEQNFDPSLVPPPPAGAADASTRRERLPDGHSLLIAEIRVRTDHGNYRVEVGTSGEPVDALLRRLALLLAVGVPVIVVAASAGGFILVSGALRPVAQISARAEAISQHNLSERLPVRRTGDELERLADALNRMITRLDEAFQHSKRFVADASHELRTPLTVLRAELEQLQAEPSTSPALADRLGSLLEETVRLGKIVERLFALSRLDAGEAQAESVGFDLGALAAGTADQMRLLAEDRQIELSVSTEPVVVRGDRARIKQVVVNLLDNAIKYTADAGKVEIRAFVQTPWAILEVSDTGIGISAEALPHIFERFYRADPARSQGPEGAGLGLAIVESICTAHGGQVEAHSTPGRGSRFRVQLPLAS